MELSHVRGTVRVTRDAAAAEIETKGLTGFDRALTRDPLVTRKARPQKAEDEVQDLHLPSIDETTPRNLTCLGWIATAECSPFGPRKPDKDLGCSSKIPFGSSGYCQVIDTETGERFRVMRSYCSSAAWDMKVSCSAAANFTNFHREARKAIETARLPESRIPNVPENLTERQGQRDGIVMVVYPKLVPSAYAAIRTLREVQQCQLPIEIWYLDTEFEKASDAMKPLQALVVIDNTPVINFRKILDRRASGFSAKVFAVYHSHFERILFLDADNVPSRNPNFLFSSPEFVETGAVFWPDFWHPGHTIFNINNQSLLWEFLDMPFVDMFEQESGQILIDRRRHAEALELVKFYTFHQPSYFVQMKLVYGDKDLFRLAWLKLAAPFHMIKTPPAIAGKIMNGSFCGLTMVQHDAQGDVLFLHRNSHKLMGEPLREQLNYKSRAIAWSKKKIEVRQRFRQEGKPIPSWSELKPIVQAEELPAPTLEAPEPDGLPDSVVWTHLLSFNSSFKREKYYVKTYFAYPDFPRSQNCYGQRNVSMTEHFFAQNVTDLPFAGLETNLRRFAAEAMEIKQT
uniref:RxLR effector candidate protein n=2 Tax=Hyaloperonospora arabidopsidis (strain Emoy2) TaxID=559515 RepID=M4BVY7_HYAAE